MTDWVVLEEFHLTVLAPPTLGEADANAIRRSLNSRRLHQRLRAAVRRVLRRHRPLLQARIRLSR